MNRWTRHVRALLVLDQDAPWVLPVFGTVLLSILANLAYDELRTFGGPLAALLALLVIFALAVLTIALYDRAIRSRPRGNLTPIDKPRPAQHRGLILLASNPKPIRKALDYHLPTLQYCWFITTPDMVPMVAGLIGEYKGRVQSYSEGIADELDSQGCYRRVIHILDEARVVGLLPSDLIADITGGTKPMTTALVLACLRSDPAVELEHVPTPYTLGENKVRVPGEALDPIQITVERTAAAWGGSLVQQGGRERSASEPGG